MFYIFGDTIIDRQLVLNSLADNDEVTNTLKANISFKHTTPGGAANVAYNIKTLSERGVVFYTSPHGTREYSTGIDVLRRADVVVHETGAYSLPVVKVRVQSPFPIAAKGITRFDIDPYAAETLPQCEYGCGDVTLERLKSNGIAGASGIDGASVIVVADYHKGFFGTASASESDGRKNLVYLAETQDVLLVVDPGKLLVNATNNDNSWQHYASDRTVFKFNRRQATDYLTAAGFNYDTAKMSPAAIYAAVEHCMRAAKCKYRHLVITFGQNGYVTADSRITHKYPPYMHPDVLDVCGAGDTFLAGLAVGLVDGLDIVQACDFAQVASGIAVRTRGTATVSVKDVNRCAFSSVTASSQL